MTVRMGGVDQHVQCSCRPLITWGLATLYLIFSLIVTVDYSVSRNYPVNMVKAKRWALVRQFHGIPKEEDFRLEEEELPALKQGGMYTFSMYSSLFHCT